MKVKEQKIVITQKASDVNNLIANGWHVTSVTAGHVTTIMTSHPSDDKD